VIFTSIRCFDPKCFGRMNFYYDMEAYKCSSCGLIVSWKHFEMYALEGDASTRDMLMRRDLGFVT
jgi:hypothetical protein